MRADGMRYIMTSIRVRDIIDRDGVGGMVSESTAQDEDIISQMLANASAPRPCAVTGPRAGYGVL